MSPSSLGRGGGVCHLVQPPPGKNITGLFGPRCILCSGWGFMLGIQGSECPGRSGACYKCSGTGVEGGNLTVPASKIDAYLAEMRREIEEIERKARLLDPGLADALRLKRLLDIKMSRQYWRETIWWATASGTSINTTAAETIVFPNITIPANYMSDGRALMLKIQGSHSTLGSGTVTVIFKMRWGGVAGTLICGTGTITQLISLTAAFWEINVLLQTKSNGATGTVEGNGTVDVFGATAPTIGSATGTPARSPMTNGGQITPAPATLDLTADTALSITAQMGASNASNIILGRNFTGDSMN